MLYVVLLAPLIAVTCLVYTYLECNWRAKRARGSSMEESAIPSDVSNSSLPSSPSSSTTTVTASVLSSSFSSPPSSESTLDDEANAPLTSKLCNLSRNRAPPGIVAVSALLTIPVLARDETIEGGSMNTDEWKSGELRDYQARCLLHVALDVGRIETGIHYAGSNEYLQSLLVRELMLAGDFTNAEAVWRLLAVLYGKEEGESSAALQHANESKSSCDSWDVVLQKRVSASTLVGKPPISLHHILSEKSKHLQEGSVKLSRKVGATSELMQPTVAGFWAPPQGLIVYGAAAATDEDDDEEVEEEEYEDSSWISDDLLSCVSKNGDSTIPVFRVTSPAGCLRMKERIEAERDLPAGGSNGGKNCAFCVGLDAEWRPDSSFFRASAASACTSSSSSSGSGGGRFSPVSVLQISTQRQVFLVDCLSVYRKSQRKKNDEEERLLHGIFQVWLLDSQEIVKVGFGLIGDLKRLHDSYPQWFSPAPTITRLVDVHDLLTTCLQFCGGEVGLIVGTSQGLLHQSAAPQGSPTSTTFCPASSSAVFRDLEMSGSSVSLSMLSQCILGHPLDKRQQASDWQLRPLSLEQVRYAALDALVLIEMASRLLSCIDLTAKGDVETAATVLSSCSNDFTPSPQELAGSSSVAALSAFAYAPIQRESADSMAATTSYSSMQTRHFSSSNSSASAAFTLPSEQSPLSPTPSDRMMLSPRHVAACLQRGGIDPSTALFQIPSRHSCRETSDALQIPEWRIVKTLALFVADSPVVALLAGNDRLDFAKVARACHCEHESRIRLASKEECASFWGYAPGAFPPIAHLENFPTYLDSRVVELLRGETVSTAFSAVRMAADGIATQENATMETWALGPDHVFAGGGSKEAVLRLPIAHLISLSNASICPLSVEKGAGRVAAEPIVSDDGPVSSVEATHPTAFSSSLASSSDPVIRFKHTKPRFILACSNERLVSWLRNVGIDAEDLSGYGSQEFLRRHQAEPRGALGSDSDGGGGGDRNITASEEPPSSASPDSKKAGSIDARGKRKLTPEEAFEWANISGRILITDNDRYYLSKKRTCCLYRLRNGSSKVAISYQEVVHHFDVFVMKGDYMSRCSTCNGSTFSLVKTADLRKTDLVSQKSKREIEDFWRCKRCEKLYWAGPSVNEGMESYNKIFS